MHIKLYKYRHRCVCKSSWLYHWLSIVFVHYRRKLFSLASGVIYKQVCLSNYFYLFSKQLCRVEVNFSPVSWRKEHLAHRTAVTPVPGLAPGRALPAPLRVPTQPTAAQTGKRRWGSGRGGSPRLCVSRGRQGGAGARRAALPATAPAPVALNSLSFVERLLQLQPSRPP